MWSAAQRLSNLPQSNCQLVRAGLSASVAFLRSNANEMRYDSHESVILERYGCPVTLLSSA